MFSSYLSYARIKHRRARSACVSQIRRSIAEGNASRTIFSPKARRAVLRISYNMHVFVADKQKSALRMRSGGLCCRYVGVPAEGKARNTAEMFLLATSFLTS